MRNYPTQKKNADASTSTQQVESQQQIVVKKKNKAIKWIILLVIILGLILPFHYVPSHLKVFPKDNFTFSYTIITQSDIDKLLERYNDCETIFQKQSISNELLFRKLSEKGLIYYDKKLND